MQTPGWHTMSVATTSCDALGWVSDRHGYRYATHCPHSGQPWPAMPECFTSLALHAAAQAGYAHFQPNSCLINVYVPGAKMSLHQDNHLIEALKTLEGDATTVGSIVSWPWIIAALLTSVMN